MCEQSPSILVLVKCFIWTLRGHDARSTTERIAQIFLGLENQGSSVWLIPHVSPMRLPPQLPAKCLSAQVATRFKARGW